MSQIMSQIVSFFRFWSPFFEPMSIRASLFRFGILFMLVFLISLLPFVKVANAQEILPFNQVKPGDRGYGLTVFRGIEPEIFNFEVLDTLNYGVTKYIVVILSGGPVDENGVEIIKDGNVYNGMSGSPLYIDGKIIGALSMTDQFLKKPQALVTPIELMVNFKTVALDSLNKFLNDFPDTRFLGDDFVIPDNAQQLKAGDSYTICEVWDNNSDFCIGIHGTVTMVDQQNHNIFYSLGHSGLAQNGIASIPFWKAEVITTMPSIALSQKLLKKTGPMLGAVIFNGPFAQIARFGAVPPSVPLTVRIENNFRGTLVRKHFFAYTPDIGTNISRTLSGMNRLIDSVFDTYTEVRVDISGLPQIYFFGTTQELSAVGSVVNVFSNYAATSNIENISVMLSARPKYGILELKKADIENLKENDNKLDLKLTLVAGNGEFFNNTLNFSVDKKYLNKKLSISSGNKVASIILSALGPSQDTIDLLNKVTDRNALYLYFTEDENINAQEPPAIIISIGSGLGNNLSASSSQQEESPTIKKDKEPETVPNKKTGGNLTNGWEAQPPQTPMIEILSKIDLPGDSYLIRGSKDIVLTLTPDTKTQPLQQKKKKRFWLF